MAFEYVPGLPNPPDNPSDDVGSMQSNCNTVGLWVNVDHVGFNNAAGGKHNQVTFASNNPPASGTVTPPVLFTNTQDGAGNNLPNSLAELFFYSGTPAQGQNNYVLKSNGSVVLLGGVILKWGSGNVGNSTTVAINFTSTGMNPLSIAAFPNNIFGVFCQALGSDTNQSCQPSSLEPTGFNLKASQTHIAYNWIAIGN